jgi:hypothetical protein
VKIRTMSSVGTRPVTAMPPYTIVSVLIVRIPALIQASNSGKDLLFVVK